MNTKTTESTKGSKEKLTTRDLITLAVFSVIFSLIILACNFIGAIPILHPFAMGIALIPAGIVWMYLRVKIAKPGAIVIQVSVLALIMIALGSIWLLTLGMVIGGVLAEIITQARKKSYRKITIGYIVYGICSTACANLPPLVARDYFYNASVTNMDPALLNEIIGFMTGPIVAASIVVSIICSLLGAYIGRRMLKKHFERAGIN
jgi:energy-coupling factor transport system substrate-specific component